MVTTFAVVSRPRRPNRMRRAGGSDFPDGSLTRHGLATRGVEADDLGTIGQVERFQTGEILHPQQQEAVDLRLAELDVGAGVGDRRQEWIARLGTILERR